ncbi:MAG: thioredoxin domain-containing protein [Spirochaetes bacterium]|nr:thioredoxin domain-containing protein [Spirochaetota bacterium]
MKKYIYLILALSIAGALLSGILLLQHYYPQSKIGFITCGEGIINPCLSLARSNYSTVFGIPVAAYGLLWNLLVIFILLIADYAGGRYPACALAVIFPLSAIAFAADIALGGILIATGIFCKFCVATYAVNAAILALAIVWLFKARRDEQFSLAGTLRGIVSAEDSSPDRKAFYSSFVLFVFLLCFAIFSTSYILKLKTGNTRVSADKISTFLDNFYNSPPEKITLPESGIVMGNPEARVTITVFTDFLCSACYRFYQVERLLLNKYGDDIRIVYYNFPLDQGCNPTMRRSVYKNSCIASRAIFAALDGDILEDYVVRHFQDYRRIHGNYNEGTAIETLRMIPPGSRPGMDEARFNALMNSEDTSRRIAEHISAAKQIGIDSTPTLFIGGRRLVGVPPVEVLDRIVDRELAR